MSVLSKNATEIFQFLLLVAETETKCYDAFHEGRHEEAVTLIKQIKDLHTVKSKSNLTVLHYAAYHGWLDIVKELITEHHFNPDCEDDDGNTPLNKARSSGKRSVVDYLEEAIGTFSVCLHLCTNCVLYIIILLSII